MDIMSYIKPELIVVAIVLYFVGIGWKKSQMKDKFIPFILGGLGIFLATLYVLATSDIFTLQSILMAVFVGITQGILCAGMSVYVNQIIKQSKKEE